MRILFSRSRSVFRRLSRKFPQQWFKYSLLKRCPLYRFQVVKAYSLKLDFLKLSGALSEIEPVYFIHLFWLAIDVNREYHTRIFWLETPVWIFSYFRMISNPGSE